MLNKIKQVLQEFNDYLEYKQDNHEQMYSTNKEENNDNDSDNDTNKKRR